MTVFSGEYVVWLINDGLEFLVIIFVNKLSGIWYFLTYLMWGKE